MPRTGFHLGLAAGHDEAVAHAAQLGAKTVQIFTHSPHTFAFPPLDARKAAHITALWKKHDIHPVFSHCNYLINLASTDNRTFYGSLNTVAKELEYARAFGCGYFVLHVGKHKEAGAEAGLKQIAKAVVKLKDDIRRHKVTVLFETVAGQGTEIGTRFEELTQLLASLDPDVQERIGVCVDTCHIFAAGYDLRTKAAAEHTIREMERTFGVARVKLIHVNDSKGALGGHLDRHEHLGQGQIGLEGLQAFLSHPKLRGIPMVLETPVDERGDTASDLAALNAFF